MTHARDLAYLGIIIDRFHVSSEDLEQKSHFFLTHFHSDHTPGLHTEWTKAPLHVSQGTLQVMQLRYGEDSPVCLHATEWVPFKWRSIRILHQNMKITCVPAHHCPGAVMWLFKTPDEHIVHTGDYRFIREMKDWPIWKQIRPVDHLFMDSSFHLASIKIPDLETSVEALEDIYQSIEGHQRMAVFIHTSGLELLIGTWCKLYGRQWFVHSSAKNPDETHFGLSDIAPEYEALGKQKNADSTIWCVGEGFRDRVHATAKTNKWVFIRPSAIWFICHRQELAGEPGYQFGTAIPDETNTYRLFYSTHASYDENQKLLKMLQPDQVTHTVPVINPTKAREYGSATPNWEAYFGNLPLGKFKSIK